MTDKRDRAERLPAMTVRQLIQALQAVDDQDAIVHTELYDLAYGSVGRVEPYTQLGKSYVLLHFGDEDA